MPSATETSYGKKKTMHFHGRAVAAPCLLVVLAFVGAASHAQSAETERMTPLLLAVDDAPVPFRASDGPHASRLRVGIDQLLQRRCPIQKLEVLGDGAVLETLDTAAIARRLQSAGQRESIAALPKSTNALLFLNVTLAEDTQIPHELSHRVDILASDAPPGQQNISESGATGHGRPPACC